MDRRTWLKLLAIPTLAGLLATALAYAVLGPRQPPTEDLVPVVKARRPIPAKTRISADMLSVERIPARYASTGALRDPAQAEGRLTLLPLAEGEIVLSSHLAVEGSPAGLAFRIPQGRRAMSLKVDEVTGAGGFVQPGDRVDVIAVAEGEQPGTGRAVLLLEDVPVLAVNRDVEAEPSPQARPPDAYSYLTVAVTPQQALDLAVAQAFGRVHVLLRPAAEGDRVAGRLQQTTAILGR